jgi:hypothetical protein
MSRQGASWDDYYQDQEHKVRRIAKLQRIQGLRDLLETHEANPDNDHEYVLKLRARLRAAQNQLEAMSV